MEFISFSFIFRIVFYCLAVVVIFLNTRFLRKKILKDEYKEAIKKYPLALAVLEGLFFIGNCILVNGLMNV